LRLLRASGTIASQRRSCSRRRNLVVCCDKAYDSDDLRKALTAQGCSPVIASKASRAQRVPHDTELYKARSEIECHFSLLKQARRFATRYEKTLRNYAAVVALGCALLWLRI
jgi:transposase